MPPFSLPLAARASTLTPTAVNRILAEVRTHAATGASIVSLMRGEPDFSTPQHIVAAAADALARGRTGYPDNRGEMRLREAVSTKLARDNGLTYDPGTDILVTTGATFGIYAALAALVNEGDEVLVPDPVYDAYLSPIRLCGGTVRSVPSTLTHGRFCLDVAALERLVTPRTKVLLLNTPWNPVGTVFTKAELEAIGAFVIRHRLVLISDEIYEAVVFDRHRHVSPALLSAELKAQTVLVNSLSKTYAMTGWRVGYCAAPASIIASMFLVLQQSSRGPATFIQDASAVALTAPQDAVDQMRQEYTTRRTTVLQAFRDVPRVRPLPPEGGFFAMLDIRETGVPSDTARRRLLTEHGVVVAHGAAYGPGGEGTLRVSFASGGETLNQGLQRLREGLSVL